MNCIAGTVLSIDCVSAHTGLISEGSKLLLFQPDFTEDIVYSLTFSSHSELPFSEGYKLLLFQPDFTADILYNVTFSHSKNKTQLCA